MGKLKGDNILQHLKVLYVEDEISTREELGRYLKRRVGKIYTGSNGLEGVSLFDKNLPHIIITDLKMPVMNGIEMAKKIRYKGYETPIIITSALSDSEIILEAVDIGIVKYVVKPIQPKELIDSMETMGKEIFNQQLLAGDKEFLLQLNREEKTDMEKNIKGEVAHFIKKYSGRGPKNIQVFIEGNKIEIKASDTLTPFEQQLLNNNRNHSLVDYMRKLFYQEISHNIKESLSSLMGVTVTLDEIYCNCHDRTDRITFLISP